MARWAFMLGGLIVWMVHFFGVYALASLGDVVATADAPVWRVAVAVFSLACLVAVLIIMLSGWRALRRAAGDADSRFQRQLALGGAGLGAVGIVWQALPAWIGH